jgi:hypothetical protein
VDDDDDEDDEGQWYEASPLLISFMYYAGNAIAVASATVIQQSTK